MYYTIYGCKWGNRYNWIKKKNINVNKHIEKIFLWTNRIILLIKIDENITKYESLQITKKQNNNKILILKNGN